MKKVLVITYYWPPSGGPSVQRVLKFCKYLPEFGWKPYVLTTSDGEFLFIDESLLSEVNENVNLYHSNSFSLHSIYKKFCQSSHKNFVPYGFTDKASNSFIDKVARWMKYNLIPDTRVPWYFTAVQRAEKIIKKERINLIFSSSPPQTNHLIACRISKKMRIPWIADFRDPWTEVFWLNNDNSLRIKFVHLIDKYIEKKVINNANAITTVGPSLVKILQKKTTKPIYLITNGYDDKYFYDNISYIRSYKFRITYAGSLSKEQNPLCFLETVKNIIKTKEIYSDLEVLFLGNFPNYVIKLVKSMKLENRVVFKPYTSYKKSIEIIINSAILLFIIPNTKDNKCILTSKLFDYLGANRPILGYGPSNGDASKILEETNVGKMFDYHDYRGASNYIQSIYYRWKNNENPIDVNNESTINKYSRHNLTKKMADIFEDV